MPSRTKSFGPNRWVARNKSRSRIYNMSLKELQKTRAHMRPSSLLDKQIPSKNINIGQQSAKIVNHSLAKDTSKSSYVPTSKEMKQSTVSSHLILLKKQKALLRSRVDRKDNSKTIHALKRKREVDEPTNLKAIPGLVPMTDDGLGQYSDSSSRLKKRVCFDKDKEEDITRATYSTTTLESSKDTHMVPMDGCMIEGNKRQDEIAVDKVFGESQNEGDTTKENHALDSTLSYIHCNSQSISSQRDNALFLDDNHNINLTFENVEIRESIEERNMGQFVNCVSTKRKEPLFKENHKALDDDSNFGVQVDDKSCEHMKKLGQPRATGKDEGEEDETIIISKNDHAKVSMSSSVQRQCYSCSKPIDKPTWSGVFKTDNTKYVLSDGHLSTKSCEKAWNFSKQLLKVVEVKRLSRMEVWPNAWVVSKPTINDIGIYFFPHEMRQDNGWDQLVREVMENNLALQTIIGEVEMLIFPSILLPNHHQTFQRKPYLWGVFKHRPDRSAMVEEPLNAMGHHEKEKEQTIILDQPNHMLPDEEPNQDMIRMASNVPLERHMLPSNDNTQEVEASCLKGATNKGFDLKAPSKGEGQAEATTFPASHGHIDHIGHTPAKLMSFVVVRKTPKLDQIIQELEQEGAFVFAMQGEIVGAGPWAASKATVPRKLKVEAKA